MDTTSIPADVAALLDRYANALVGGDLPGVAADAYRAQGLVDARPELRAVDPLTPALTLIDVRWAYLDEAGHERRHSSYRYLLRRSDPGQLGIQVVVDTTPAQP